MSVSFYTENINFPDLNKKGISEWIKNVANSYNKNVGELTYIFCNDEKILEINIQFLNHNFYTDIITFDYNEGDKISGDIFISLDTVLSNSQKYNIKFKDELHRVIIHGVLHLCGIDDQSEGEKPAMREAENKALNLLFDYQ